MSDDATTDEPADIEHVGDSADIEQVGDLADDPRRFELPVVADIRLAAEIHQQCLAAIDAAGDVSVGCGAVDRIDGAVLQALGALAEGLRQGGRRLELIHRTEAFDRAVAVLGFDELLTTGAGATVGPGGDA